jgi:hypothetical protein
MEFTIEYLTDADGSLDVVRIQRNALPAVPISPFGSIGIAIGMAALGVQALRRGTARTPESG